MLILVTNDDGIASEGLAALAQAMSALGEVVVVAPDGNRSAAAHSLTLDYPLRITETKPRWYSVDGTPADCVHLALNGILKNNEPYLVACGINKGGNMGQDITYSGTVMAALESTLIGIPAMAVSVDARHDFEWSGATQMAHSVARHILEHGLPKDTLLNLNVPNLPLDKIKGLKVTRQGRRIYGDIIDERVDPRGRTYYWIAAQEQGFDDIPGSDMVAVRDGYASLTPIIFQLTNDEYWEQLQKLSW